MAGNIVTLTFAGDASKLESAMDSVGSKSTQMAGKLDVTTNRFNDMGRSVGDSEAGFIGLADLLDGLGGAFGLPTEGAVKFIRGMADITGGISTLMPIVSSVTTLFPRLAGAMTFVSAHPLMVAFLVGGAIIAGLILLEKKFGIVSNAIGFLGDAFKGAWPAIRGAINLIIGGVNVLLNALTKPFELLGRLPGAPKIFSQVGGIQIPKLDVGGTVLETGVAVVHRGEVVSPANKSGGGFGGGGVNVYVSGSVVSERDLVRAVRDGLAREGRVGGTF